MKSRLMRIACTRQMSLEKQLDFKYFDKTNAKCSTNWCRGKWFKQKKKHFMRSTFRCASFFLLCIIWSRWSCVFSLRFTRLNVDLMTIKHHRKPQWMRHNFFSFSLESLDFLSKLYGNCIEFDFNFFPIIGYMKILITTERAKCTSSRFGKRQ